MPGRAYCRECDKLLQAERQRIRTEQSREHRSADETPVSDIQRQLEASQDPFDKMICECLRREYDPDTMLGISRLLLCLVDFQQDIYGIWRPVAHQSDKSRAEERTPRGNHRTI